MIGMSVKPAFKPGDLVIYRMTKHSECPGPRAKSISPSPHGDEYKYLVDKFWIVDQLLEDGQIQLRTRRGKSRIMRQDDQNLRPAAWWELILYHRQFPQRDVATTSRQEVSEKS